MGIDSSEYLVEPEIPSAMALPKKTSKSALYYREQDIHKQTIAYGRM